MSFSDTAENDLLQLLFNNVDMALVGDATGLRGASAAGSFYLSLHTADPGDAGSQSTSEAAYSGYARVAVVRPPRGRGAGVTHDRALPHEAPAQTRHALILDGAC